MLKKVLLLAALPCAAFAQNDPNAVLGGPQFRSDAVADSLDAKDNADNEGRYYYARQYELTANSRAYFYYSASGYAANLVIQTPSGKMIRKANADEPTGYKSSKIEFDTAFGEAGVYNVYITSVRPKKQGHFNYEVHVASPEAMEYKPAESLCWKIFYLIKQSDVGYRFIRKGDKIKEDNIVFDREFYYTTAPVNEPATSSRLITDAMFADFYECSIARDYDITQVKPYYEQAREHLKQCFGTMMAVEEKIDGNRTTFFARFMAPAPAVKRSLGAFGTGDLVKYEVKLELYENKEKKTGDLVLTVTNKFVD